MTNLYAVLRSQTSCLGSEIKNRKRRSVVNIKGAFSKVFTLTLSCSHSCFSSFPVLNFSEERPVSEEIRRVINCTEDISSEKNATGKPLLTAIFRAIESVSAVLPIPGLAAMIIKSLGCHPRSYLIELYRIQRALHSSRLYSKFLRSSSWPE
jgi:hypothetical protein